MSSGGRRVLAGWPDCFRAGWALDLPSAGTAVALAGQGPAAGFPYDLVTFSAGADPPTAGGRSSLRSESPCPSVDGPDSRSAGEPGPVQCAHELTEGVRMLGLGFDEVLQGRLGAPHPDDDLVPVGRFVRANCVVELGRGRVFFLPGTAAHGPAVHRPSVAPARRFRGAQAAERGLAGGLVAEGLRRQERLGRPLVVLEPAPCGLGGDVEGGRCPHGIDDIVPASAKHAG